MKNNLENILVYEILDPPSIEPAIASKRKDKMKLVLWVKSDPNHTDLARLHFGNK